MAMSNRFMSSMNLLHQSYCDACDMYNVLLTEHRVCCIAALFPVHEMSCTTNAVCSSRL